MDALLKLMMIDIGNCEKGTLEERSCKIWWKKCMQNYQREKLEKNEVCI